MILPWVLSLILLCATYIGHLEKMTAHSAIHIRTIRTAHHHFEIAEKQVLHCERQIEQSTTSFDSHCFIQSIGKHIWKITSKQKPGIEIHVYVNHEERIVQRLNWRQTFE